jgi:lipopolysaccharide assembly protein A
MTDLHPPPEVAANRPPSMSGATTSATLRRRSIWTRGKTRGQVPRTRAGAAWVGACVAVVALVALIIFVAQNMSLAVISFVGLNGQFPLAVMLIAAVACGVVITLVVGSTRILQLRRVARRRDRRNLA